MGTQWKRTTVVGNDGKPLTVYSWRDYELAREVNQGEDGGWVFELTNERRRVGLYEDVEAAKRAAELREAGLLSSTLMTSAFEGEVEPHAQEGVAPPR